MKTNKYIIFILFFLYFILIFTGTVFAYEVNYPDIPGLPSINKMDPDNPDLGHYIGYFFGLGIYVAGFLSLLSFSMGAIDLIRSTDNPETSSNAKDRMKNAILGLCLTAVSFMIIRTINPQIATPTLTPLQGIGGVYYFNGKYQKPVGEEVPDTSVRPEGYNKLQYCCNSNCQGGSGPMLLIWEFPNKGLEAGNTDLKTVTVVRKACGETENINFGSFRAALESPGVYYFVGQGCSGMGSTVITGSENHLSSNFDKNIKSVRIVNDANNRFGVIFHKEIGLDTAGQCSEPIINSNSGAICQNITPNNIAVSATNVFAIESDQDAAGDGVSFYSTPYGWNTGAEAGYYDVFPPDINPIYKKSSSLMCFEYSDIDRPDEYQYRCGSLCESDNSPSSCPCPPPNQNLQCPNPNPGQPCPDDATAHSCSPTGCDTFQACYGSIEIAGNYLVAIYSKTRNNVLYCQTFMNDVENLKTEPVAISPLGDVYVIPIKR